ncbi:unnamed protein product [Ectocarpus sp. 4 AP-2014]
MVYSIRVALVVVLVALASLSGTGAERLGQGSRHLQETTSTPSASPATPAPSSPIDFETMAPSSAPTASDRDLETEAPVTNSASMAAGASFAAAFAGVAVAVMMA